MDNLIFSLNATVPIFILMLLGLLLKYIGWIDDIFAEKMNRFVFLVPLPVLVFHDLATVDFSQVWDTRFVLFCLLATVASIAISAAVSFLWKDRTIQGEFIQSSYRSSAALLGIAFIQNIYGTAGMAPLMIIGSVPLYNVMAVAMLSVFCPGREKLSSKVVRMTLRGIVTNPIIIGIAAGLLWSALKIPMPHIVEKTVTSISGMATPMGLMAMGASFDVHRAFAKARPALTAAVLKLVGFCALFLPVAIQMGFREEKLVAILVMLGSATTVSCFVMAKNMGHDGILSSSVIMLTTFFSAFSLTGWLYILKSWGML
ncbi:transporter [Lachnospiraceae bacterium]|uniref:AEC family transporter n=1 Tax=Extibacter sp. GGCC_0201 TaxID=2731209 RepID=UPI001AA140C0|nr:AEC family transporter [Extibacter sp. GGCC_0201]MBO1722024.1 AEC family transporter [Extibacter sp. GGCC_0201]BDF35144.1 transporter [Lachnospiraceae bacterium]BDF39145.1 transporter [Lachnospiraceae bacterium]